MAPEAASTLKRGSMITQMGVDDGLIVYKGL